MKTSFKNSFEKLKKADEKSIINPNPDDPREILNQLIKDLNDAYPSQLDGTIGFGEDMISAKRTDYNFYLIAAIGGGYVYHLFSLVPHGDHSDNLGYPLDLKLGKTGVDMGLAKDGGDLRELIEKALESTLVQNIIINLVEQTRHYKESRNG